jgi:hypothetical protein
LELEKLNYFVVETKLNEDKSNVQGRIIFTESKNQFNGLYKTTIDLSKQAKGFYSIQIITKTELINKKIIVN